MISPKIAETIAVVGLELFALRNTYGGRGEKPVVSLSFSSFRKSLRQIPFILSSRQQDDCAKLARRSKTWSFFVSLK